MVRGCTSDCSVAYQREWKQYDFARDVKCAAEQNRLALMLSGLITSNGDAQCASCVCSLSRAITHLVTSASTAIESSSGWSSRVGHHAYGAFVLASVTDDSRLPVWPSIASFVCNCTSELRKEGVTLGRYSASNLSDAQAHLCLLSSGAGDASLALVITTRLQTTLVDTPRGYSPLRHKTIHAPTASACLGRFADRVESGLGSTTLGSRFLLALPGLMKLTGAIGACAAALLTSGLRVGVISVGISGIFLGAVGVLSPWLAFGRAVAELFPKTPSADPVAGFCCPPLKPFQENACGRSAPPPPSPPPMPPFFTPLSRAIPPLTLGDGCRETGRACC